MVTLDITMGYVLLIVFVTGVCVGFASACIYFDIKYKPFIGLLKALAAEEKYQKAHEKK